MYAAVLHLLYSSVRSGLLCYIGLPCWVVVDKSWKPLA